MERKNEFKRFCNIIHCLANYMNMYCGDLLLDLPTAWDMYCEGENWPIFFIRKTGADLSNRYEEILKEQGNENPTIEQAVQYAQKTLGINFSVEITSELVIIKSIKMEKWELRDIKERIKDFSEVVVADNDLV